MIQRANKYCNLKVINKDALKMIDSGVVNFLNFKFPGSLAKVSEDFHTSNHKLEISLSQKPYDVVKDQ